MAALPAKPAPGSPVLVLDAASPRVSVAVGTLGTEAAPGALLAWREEPLERSSRRLLEMIDEVLRETGLAPADLGGIAALRGPGSFTGLRVGLATALGLHQALGMPATALPTLQVLASLAPPGPGPRVGAVDVLRGEWAVQAWPEEGSAGAEGASGRGNEPGTKSAGRSANGRGEDRARESAGPSARGRRQAPGGRFPGGGPLSELEIRPAAALARFAPGGIAGFGLAALAAAQDFPPDLRIAEPPALAPAALRLLAARPGGPAWDPALLTSPIYGRPPAVTLPKPRPPGVHGSTAAAAASAVAGERRDAPGSLPTDPAGPSGSAGPRGAAGRANMAGALAPAREER